MQWYVGRLATTRRGPGGGSCRVLGRGRGGGAFTRTRKDFPPSEICETGLSYMEFLRFSDEKPGHWFLDQNIGFSLAKT